MLDRPPDDALTFPAWMSKLPIKSCRMPLRRYEIGIAVPAKNEALQITACLAALEVSAKKAGRHRVCVTVLVNNSGDATATRARAYKSASMVVRVVEVALGEGDAHAGGARRLALELALADLPDSGVLMTTDADSMVDMNWIAANLAEIEFGADAVAGVVTFAPGTCLPISASRHAEWHLAQLQARLHSLIDPRPQERWPTHIWAWGASLAVTVRAYRAVGGLPALPLAEDRAFADVLDRCGFRVRRSHAPFVVTSHRQFGRAPGGLADLLTSYGDDRFPCDAALEPTAALVRRLAWRVRLRRRHATKGPHLCAHLAERLRIAPGSQLSADLMVFGHWWTAIETASVQFKRERIMPPALPKEIGRAERMIRLIERECPVGIAAFAGAQAA